MPFDDTDITDALTELAGRQTAYQRYRRYAEGRHDLRFSSDSFRSMFAHLFRTLSYNKCGRVVDAFSDRLLITGWESQGESDTENDPLELAAIGIWQENAMALRQTEVHAEALQQGDAAVIVWPDPDTGRPVIAPNIAERVIVRYDDDDPFQVAMAVKAWPVARGEHKGKWRVTVYDEERISRFITKSKSDQAPKKISALTAFEDDEQPEIANPYGVCPVIPFRNTPRTGQPGVSELRDIIPLQDGLNKSLADMMVGAEFQAYRQRWVTGLEPHFDDTGNPIKPFEPGADRIWALPENARAGEFSAADLTQYTATQDSWEFKIARTSGVPVHWLIQTGTPPSGESLKTAESGYVSKLRKQQQSFGEPWRQVMQLALLQAGVSLEQSAVIAPVWQSPESRSDQEFWSIALQKIASGLPAAQIWAEAGYSVAEITNFETANRAAAEERARLTGILLDRGQLPGTEGL